MKLQILVPHYHESADVIKPLLDSIALQQNVDFDEIGVIVCHDGKDIKDFCFTDCLNLVGGNTLPDCYPFKIEQVSIPHKGVSAARNGALDASMADYVMFCDIDDMFYNMCGLWIVFREMETAEFDSLTSIFVEENRIPKDPKDKNCEEKVPFYINRPLDSTFVHGKIHRRQYLIDKGIRWNDSLTVHEDSYFNILCQNLSGNVKYCQTPFYLWKWRDDSVCRHDPKYILKTYNNMLDSNDALVEEFLRREMKDKAMFFCASMVFDAYYTMNKLEWINQENKEYRRNTEQRFAIYFKSRESLWNDLSLNEKMKISAAVRNRAVQEGMPMESVTIDDWLKKIKDMAQ